MIDLGCGAADCPAQALSDALAENRELVAENARLGLSLLGNSLNDLRDKVHNLAIEKGWHEDRDISNPHVLGSMLCLIHSEVSEALEDVRKGRLEAMLGGSAGTLANSAMSAEEFSRYASMACKPVGLPSELADVIIRTLDLCGALGIDIEQAVQVKHAYNATRSHRHGGKKL